MCEQDRERERLGQVVVGSGIEALGVIGCAVFGGQHQHGQVTACGAQLRAHTQAVQPREQEVEDHRVVVELAGPVQAVDTVRGDLHRIACRRQAAAERGGQQLIVFHHENTHIRILPAQS